MARPFFPVWPAVVAVSGVVTVAGMVALWTKYRSSDNFCVLPRLSLILALQENVERLQLEVDSENWDDYVLVLLGKLGAVVKELSTVRDTSKLNGLDRVSKVIDAELVAFLRVEPGVASILDSYMPRSGQNWNAFLRDKTEDEKSFFNIEITHREETLQEKLKESLLDSIQELKSILVQSLSADVSRGESDQEAENLTQRYKIVKIWYTTDRELTTDGEYIGKISRRPLSALQDGVPLQYGLVEVGIPVDHHVMGSMEAPARHSKEEADPSKHVVIFSVDTKLRGDSRKFLGCINSELTTLGENNGELLIFIHGYNVSHLSAVKRAAQLKYDLGFSGTVILYSWSSAGTLKGYLTDQKNVKETTKSLELFLKLIMEEVKSPCVHILAHSMGNRALIRALHNLHEGEDRHSPARYPLSQLIFVAADEKRSRFERLVQKITETYKAIPSGEPATSTSTGRSDLNGISSSIVDTRPHLSVYCSSEDLALACSRIIHGYQRRLGDIDSLFGSEELLDDHDVIDASGTKKGISLGHSYHVESPTVMKDIKILLAKKMPASHRKNLHPIHRKGRSYYAIRAP